MKTKSNGIHNTIIIFIQALDKLYIFDCRNFVEFHSMVKFSIEIKEIERETNKNF